MAGRSARRPGHLGHPVELGFQPGPERFRVDVRLLQNRRRQAPRLLQQRRQQVFHVDLLVAVSRGRALRRPDGLLQFFGKAVDVHI